MQCTRPAYNMKAHITRQEAERFHSKELHVTQTMMRRAGGIQEKEARTCTRREGRCDGQHNRKTTRSRPECRLANQCYPAPHLSQGFVTTAAAGMRSPPSDVGSGLVMCTHVALTAPPLSLLAPQSRFGAEINSLVTGPQAAK